MEAPKPCLITRPGLRDRSESHPGAAPDRLSGVVRAFDREGGTVRIAADPFVEEAHRPRELLDMLLESPANLECRIEEWMEAGADILLAPTLSATPAALRPLGLAHRAAEINQTAVEALRRVSTSASRVLLVAAQVGPLGPRWQDGVFHAFDEAYIHYHEQAKSLALAGPDLVVIRRITGIRLLRAAVVAMRELWSGPLLVLLDNPRPYLLETALRILPALGVQGIGLEGFPPPDSLEVIAHAREHHGFPLAASVLPAGLAPRDGLAALARAGLDVALLGGPEGLRALRMLRGRAAPAGPDVPLAEPAGAGRPGPASSTPAEDLLVALELDPLAQGVRAESGLPFVRASHTGICLFSETEILAREGMRRRSLEEWVGQIEAGQGRPLALVVKDPLVLETGLKGAAGRSLVYLDSADASIWQSMLYLASRHGAMPAFRLKPMGRENGKQGTGSCMPVLLKLLAEAREYGLSPGDLYVDPIGIDESGAPSWDPKSVEAALEQMRMAKLETGVRWILGCHHFRDGDAAPDPLLQSQILLRALATGLDAVFLSAEQEHLLRVLNSHRAR